MTLLRRLDPLQLEIVACPTPNVSQLQRRAICATLRLEEQQSLQFLVDGLAWKELSGQTWLVHFGRVEAQTESNAADELLSWSATNQLLPANERFKAKWPTLLVDGKRQSWTRMPGVCYPAPPTRPSRSARRRHKSSTEPTALKRRHPRGLTAKATAERQGRGEEGEANLVGYSYKAEGQAILVCELVM